ncbi:MAG: DNA/RNA non-specific endonuclease, partial [Prevotella sp.]|nr:DNA/RNA non-specific endonuclease [Prevotella sp.]
QPEISRLEFPKVKGGNSFVVNHKVNNAPDPDGVNYSIEWDKDKKAQRWSCYQMNKGYAGSSGRSDAWAEDPDIPSAYRLDDSRSYYSGSGFTRGHIIPSADRQYSVSANRQTFYYSNIHPQYGGFNSGKNYDSPWLRLEDQVRTWTRRSSTDTLYVCKGGTIDSEDNILMRIKNELIVPKYFFVACLAKGKTGYSAIAFYIKHDNNDHGANPLSDYAMSIDQLEEKTGIDFFCNLPDNEEKRVEGSYSLNVWGIQ